MGGAPFPKHAVLPVRKEHFAHWLELFVETVNAHFAGPKAEEAHGRAASSADTFAPFERCVWSWPQHSGAPQRFTLQNSLTRSRAVRS